MDWKVLVTVFGTVFVAELGDKTQLATLLFAADKQTDKWMGCVGATSALGVLGGGLVSQYISERALHILAGVGFITVGVWTLWK
jgi:putative Ca2+/H+ antiporter (TMEM165/GDT1 family)